MREVTIQTFAQLEAVEWFSRVGIHEFDTVRMISTWKEAIASCSSRRWEAVTLEAANVLRERVLAASRKRFSQWNTIAIPIREFVLPLVQRKVQAVVEEHHLPDVFRHCVEWDMVHLGMECEYADIVKPTFFAAQSFWYSRGHFPCGWDGPLKGGMVVVF